MGWNKKTPTYTLSDSVWRKFPSILHPVKGTLPSVARVHWNEVTLYWLVPRVTWMESTVEYRPTHQEWGNPLGHFALIECWSLLYKSTKFTIKTIWRPLLGIKKMIMIVLIYDCFVVFEMARSNDSGVGFSATVVGVWPASLRASAVVRPMAASWRKKYAVGMFRHVELMVQYIIECSQRTHHFCLL